MNTPREYGLPYDEFRPGQQEIIDWSLEPGQVKIIQAATGTGKSSIPKAISTKRRAVVLVRTKALQSQNYAADLQFAPLYGRANYACADPRMKFGTKADACPFSEVGMRKCNHVGQCEYVNRRDTAQRSNAAALNYAFWLSARTSWPAFDHLILDEAHQLIDLIIEWAGVSISDAIRQEWELPLFPMIRMGASVEEKLASGKASKWLNESIQVLRGTFEKLINSSDDNDKARAKVVEKLGQKIRATRDALEASPQDWYIKSGPAAIESGMGFIAKPLTARHHFKHYFERENTNILLMSATIGNAETFADELGIKDYDYREMSSVWKPEQRPVHALDCPRMGFSASDAAFNQQADAIAKAIHDCPSDWSGIIHTSSKRAASLLAERLQRRKLESRMWTPRAGMSTSDMITNWHAQMKRVPGSIMVNWALHEGYDGRDEKICIAAKCLYPATDDYETRRRNYNGKMYLQRTAWATEQALGRTRRGFAGDYDTPTERGGYVAIADGSYKWLRNYFSPDLQAALVE